MATWTFVVALAWFRFRTTWSRRWSSFAAIVVLIALLGGLAMASIAGARRTQSSYPVFLTSTNPSDLSVSIFNPATNGGPGPNLTSKIEHLPGVKRVRDYVTPTLIPLSADGAPRLATLNLVVTLGSLDGGMYRQDRLTATSGRLANPNNADEIMMTAGAARLLNAHVGDLLPLGLFLPSQQNLPGFGTPRVLPALTAETRLVGIVVLDNQVVQDDIDSAYGFTIVTPALVRDAVAKSPVSAMPEGYGVQLIHGARDDAKVEGEIINLVPPHMTYNFHVTSRVLSEVQLAIKPESVALGAFGVIAALVAIVLSAQAIARQLRSGDDERRILRALGAGTSTILGDALIGVVVSIAVGAVLAMIVAILLSPLAPLGPTRPVYPDRGIAFDWTVLASGLCTLIVVLGMAALLMSFRAAPHRISNRGPSTARSSITARGAETTGMPVTGVIGVRFAFERSPGRDSVPALSTLFGTVLAVGLLVATLTFANSLQTLVSNPPLYGWNWSYMINPSNNVPPQTLRLLSHDPEVATWTGVNYNDAEIDGLITPVIMSAPRPRLSPPILSGHGLFANDEIVLGAATLTSLHKRVGDTVTVSYGNPQDFPLYIPPTRLKVVGIATFPAVGYSSFVADHTAMGTGALLSTGIMPAAFIRASTSRDPNLDGPGLVFVEMKPGVGAAVGLANLQKIADTTNRVVSADPNAAGNSVTVLGVQHPVQIVNYRSIGSTPILLAMGLAAGAVVALALTLISSVRHRRRDLAVLKVLGLTPHQLALVIAWQSTVTAIVGIVAGLPLGILIGRQLWSVFARNINAVPDPTVPIGSLVVVALGAIVFANLVAAVPGHVAARTPTSLVLRAD